MTREYLNRLAGAEGPIARSIADAARRYANGETLEILVTEVKRVVEQEITNSSKGGDGTLGMGEELFQETRTENSKLWA